MPMQENEYRNFTSDRSNAIVYPYFKPVSALEQKEVCKYQAERFKEELRELIANYAHSTLGGMEQSGLIQGGPLGTLNTALNQLELITEDLNNL